MIKELKDLKPTVEVLEPGKLESSRGGAPQFQYPACNPPSQYTSPHRLSFVCNLCGVDE